MCPAAEEYRLYTGVERVEDDDHEHHFIIIITKTGGHSGKRTEGSIESLPATAFQKSARSGERLAPGALFVLIDSD